MTVDRKVLLARPHPFIVSEMKPLLVSAGYMPSPLSEMNDITSGAWRDAKGAVISIAVSSVMPESAETVFSTLRSYAPEIPVVFAGLNDIDIAGGTIQRLVKASVPDATVIPVRRNNEHVRGLGKGNVFLYIEKDVLKTAEGTALAKRMLQRHFS
jgi:hypothetical protein